MSQKKIRVVTLTKTLPCKLTEEELKDRGRALAQACEDIQNEESRQQDIKSELKAKLLSLEAERARLATIVRRQEEQRTVVVDERYVYAEGVVEQYRQDTGERIYKREMTDAERQESLPLEE